MPDAFTQTFHTPYGQLTSVVLDKNEFDALCEELQDVINLAVKERTTAAQIKQIKDTGIIPMIKKGTKTQFIFDRYNISTQVCAIIVRGKGQELMSELMDEIGHIPHPNQN